MIIDPRSVLEYSAVIVLSSSMGLPILMYNERSQVYGLIAIVLLALILADLGSLLENNFKYFQTAVFLRLLFFFSLCIYCYLGSYLPICNSAVFSYAFLETWFGILTYSTLRDERMKREQKQAKFVQELKEKYDRGELSEKESATYERLMDEAEYEKIMNEFTH
ncbi:DEKNAAC105600 [Brettanomyces naardenensis]|uniref:DEKNAAC105600 n=1 Tax=Brettanomyces naardenensis TaxID=13370 RepID=A0A448YTN1_BRENA|nr:DEKNAAC105600 [Brettanomyces naardenensis]